MFAMPVRIPLSTVAHCWCAHTYNHIVVCLSINRSTGVPGARILRDGSLAKILLYYSFYSPTRGMIKLQKYSPFHFTICCGFYDITRCQRGRANCIRVRYVGLCMGCLFFYWDDMFPVVLDVLYLFLQGVAVTKKVVFRFVLLAFEALFW